MNRTQLIGCVVVSAVLLATSGSRKASAPASVAPVVAESDTGVIDEPATLRDLRQQANELFRAGQYVRSASIYRNGFEQAIQMGAQRSAIRFLNNLGSALNETYKYREALRAYLEARRLAELVRDEEALAAVSVNLSSVYLQLGQLEAAAEVANRALTTEIRNQRQFRSKLLIQAGLLKLAQGEGAAGEHFLRDAVDEAHKQQDAGSEAQAWNELGNALLDSGQTERAERAQLEGLRLRARNADDRIYFSYQSLGKVRARQGDLLGAIKLFDRAIDAARHASVRFRLWTAHYERGKVKLALGRAGEAYADLRIALGFARRWRAQVLPADVFRVSMSLQLDEIYAAFIDAGNLLYRQSGRKNYLQETFAAAEDHRAASLRGLLNGPEGWSSSLPPEYWEAISELHAAETKFSDGEGRPAPETIRQLRVRMAEMEAAAGLDLPVNEEEYSADLVRRLRAVLGAGDVFLGFHLGPARSYLYAMASDGIEVYDLPGRAQLEASAAQFTRAVSEDLPAAPELGHRLYLELFGNVSPRFLDKPLWLLALDGELFDVPFAALVEGWNGAAPAYLVERHALQMSPGILLRTEPGTQLAAGPFVGVGDPVYNRADPRWKGVRRGLDRFRITRVGLHAADVRAKELSRLAASATEVESCARSWRWGNSRPVILEGAEASKSKLIDALRRQPGVLHVAAHVLFPQDIAGPALIALSLRPNGEVEYFSSTEIANIRERLGLVVLNGCASGEGRVLPGAGLMGMTRAWLAAGARAVIASRWATPDDTGELFQNLYASLDQRPSRGCFGRALRTAQLAHLRAGGWRARPSYWAAYFCLERN